MTKHFLILNIDTINDKLYVQVNKRSYSDECYNLTFTKEGDRLQIKGFMIPTFSGNYNISIFGNSDTRVMEHCLTILPKLFEDKDSVIELLSALIKREKLNFYQININDCMNYSDAKPIDLLTIQEIYQSLCDRNFPVKF